VQAKKLDRKIRVAWFASAFIGRSASGTAQTARKIILNLILNHSDEIEIILLAKNNKEVNALRHESVFSTQRIILLPNVLGKKFSSSRQFYKFCLLGRGNEIDIINFSVPRVYPFYWLFPAKKIVCTFHAGGDITAPRDSFVLSREIYNKIIKLQWKKFHAIIAVSESAAREISLAYKIPYTAITTIYGGADNLWGQTNQIIKREPNLVLIMGRWQIYKNIHSVINAFKKFELPHNSNLKIKLVGKRNIQNNKFILDALRDFPPNQIEIIDYLTDQDLAIEYRKSGVVFHPSINEGFGLPIFEAFGEGARVIGQKDTPASEMLGGQPGTVFEDMQDEIRIVESYHKILRQDYGDIENRRSFIKNLGATWVQSSKKYALLYKSLIS
jgi:glycosyltransferase involved in cell wall biosynthesis